MHSKAVGEDDVPALQFVNTRKSFFMLRAQWLRMHERAADRPTAHFTCVQKILESRRADNVALNTN